MKGGDRVVLTSFGREKFSTNIIDVDDVLTVFYIEGDFIECKNVTKKSSFCCYLRDIELYKNGEVTTLSFLVDKWYKINDYWYAKFFSMYDTGKFWGFSESISGSGNYYGSYNRLQLKNDVIKLLEDLEEIQEFLPTGHIDKIKKINKNSEKLKSFPEEGYCLTNSPVIRSYLSSRPGTVLATSKAWDETKHIGVGWNLRGHWPVGHWPVSEKSSKELYTLEELMPFIKLVTKVRDRKVVLLNDENEFEEFLERFSNPLKIETNAFIKGECDCIQVSERDIHYTGCISSRKFFEDYGYKVITYKEWLQENNFYIPKTSGGIKMEDPRSHGSFVHYSSDEIIGFPKLNRVFPITLPAKKFDKIQLEECEVELKLIKVEHI